MPPTRQRTDNDELEDEGDDDELEVIQAPTTSVARARPANGAPVRNADRDIRVFQLAVDELEAEVEAEPDREPFPFTLRFLRLDHRGKLTGEAEEHEFLAIGNPGAGGVLVMATISRVDPDTGKVFYDLNALTAFFRRVLIEEDAQWLMSLLLRKDLRIGMEDLSEKYRWLIEECYAGLPLEQQQDSRRSRRRTGRPSTARRR